MLKKRVLEIYLCWVGWENLLLYRVCTYHVLFLNSNKKIQKEVLYVGYLEHSSCFFSFFFTFCPVQLSKHDTICPLQNLKIAFLDWQHHVFATSFFFFRAICHSFKRLPWWNSCLIVMVSASTDSPWTLNISPIISYYFVDTLNNIEILKFSNRFGAVSFTDCYIGHGALCRCYDSENFYSNYAALIFSLLGSFQPYCHRTQWENGWSCSWINRIPFWPYKIFSEEPMGICISFCSCLRVTWLTHESTLLFFFSKPNYKTRS